MNAALEALEYKRDIQHSNKLQTFATLNKWWRLNAAGEIYSQSEVTKWKDRLVKRLLSGGLKDKDN